MGDPNELGDVDLAVLPLKTSWLCPEVADPEDKGQFGCSKRARVALVTSRVGARLTLNSLEARYPRRVAVLPVMLPHLPPAG